MSGNPLILVHITMDPKHVEAFNDFYHHVYIPKLLEVIPEIISVRRYEECFTESSSPEDPKQYLTIYEIASESVMHKAFKAVQARLGIEKEAWKKWEASFKNIEHASLFQEVYAHPRTPWDGNFSNRPFLLVRLDLDPLQEKLFNEWYEDSYLIKNLADVPTWATCRRYKKVKGNPIRYLTIYEAWDLDGIKESLKLMHDKSRYLENETLKQWDGELLPAITWKDASSFRPIFRFPE